MEEPGALMESLPILASFWRKCSDQNKEKMTVAGWGPLAGGGAWPGWHGPWGHCTHVRETAGAQTGNKGEQGCGPAESGLPHLPPCQVWRKREALVETELASSTAGCFSRSQGPEKIRKECYTARCLSFERSFPDHSG